MNRLASGGVRLREREPLFGEARLKSRAMLRRRASPVSDLGHFSSPAQQLAFRASDGRLYECNFCQLSKNRLITR